jgi:arginase family enzyme
VSRLRARCPHCRTLTAVAIGDGYECHSCGATFAAGLIRVPRAWGRGGEAMAESATLPLSYPEVAVIQEKTLPEQTLALAAGLPARPLVLGGCCCAHVGAVEGLAARHERLGVVWFDAHGDLNTPETSPSGNEWGMPLRTLIDDGAVSVSAVALVGARSLDPGEEEFIAASGLRLGTAGVRQALEGVETVYVALDADVLDQAEGVSVFMPEPDGLSLSAVERLLREVVETRPLAGAGLTGLTGDVGNVAPLGRLCAALGLYPAPVD